MVRNQPAILAPVPPVGRFLSFDLDEEGSARSVADALARLTVHDEIVVGIGAPLASALGSGFARLRPFPALRGKVAVPSTQRAVWAFFSGDDAGELVLRARALSDALGKGARLVEDVATFRYREGRDLTGYEDGTENPKDARAIEVAIASGLGASLDGSSFVAVQSWSHDLAAFSRMGAREQDLAIGRARATNEEIADAPSSAHVKRAAQESFEPEAFMLRRSMPFGSALDHGLYFVAFGASLDPFERVLSRMVGLEDGTSDALFRFSRPTTGAYYWCPPLREDGRLDLRALGVTG